MLGLKGQSIISIRKRPRVARACCAPHLVQPSRCFWKTLRSSRSCSIPTAGSGSIGWRVVLVDTGEHLSPNDGERIVRLVAHHVGAEVHLGSPRVSAELPETGERFEGLLRPWRRRQPPQSANRCRSFHPRGLRRRRHHARGAGRDIAHSRGQSTQYPGGRRHLDRQDRAHQCAVSGSRKDHRSGRVDRGHPRTPMQSPEPCRTAHQGRRCLAFRSGPVFAAVAAGPHPDRGRYVVRKHSTC
jgi:hypothetical protein